MQFKVIDTPVGIGHGGARKYAEVYEAIQSLAQGKSLKVEVPTGKKPRSFASAVYLRMAKRNIPINTNTSLEGYVIFTRRDVPNGKAEVA